MDLILRKTLTKEANEVWRILQQAILRRKDDGSNQWQSGYPNLETVKSDIEKGNSYSLCLNDQIIAIAAIIFNYEPTYESIDGKWLSDGDFMVIHRVAVTDEVAGKGIATKFFQMMENFAMENKVFSIKIDTNHDNFAMLRILEKLNYIYCGEIQVYDGTRKAFQKLLK